ncbi:hypothetical protein PR202_gb25739 [Eleusine coracana subsp. coracana]|uniref:Uncharacterized protein n=1 Tax=Eleusine coracana subsp. coracana TaxID=191504 RepID=A0AAV5FRE1_ELECO|nr:hypothetical protein PR202_gb25739 [Eleusine coracana subsp. coracana]
MAHAAAAAVVPLRRPFLFLKPTRLLSSFAPPSPGLHHPHALRPAGPLPSDVEDADDPDAGDCSAVPFRKSRNELKREARRAVQWGHGTRQVLPTPNQAHTQRFGRDVREGRRRQYNYIGISSDYIL